MHPRVLAKREGDARQRIEAAAQVLAAGHNLAPELVSGLGVYERDAETRQVLRLEATAALLEALAEKSASPAETAPAETAGESRAANSGETVTVPAGAPGVNANGGTKRKPGRPRRGG